jgi:hypothetical protein
MFALDVDAEQVGEGQIVHDEVAAFVFHLEEERLVADDVRM